MASKRNSQFLENDTDDEGTFDDRQTIKKKTKENKQKQEGDIGI